MKLAQLLAPWLENINLDLEILGLAVDDRQIKPGYLFLAYKGTNSNGSQYISKAIANGAKAVVTDDASLQNKDLDVPIFFLDDLQHKLSAIAARFYNEPTQKMSVVGITGTNGKTTIAYLLMQAYELLGESSAYMGTLGVGTMAALNDTGLTTPGPLQIQQVCAQFVRDGVEHLAMEVSSHSLDQGRVDDVYFDQAIFTNISHDHLDYHGTFEHYLTAKTKLFKFDSLKSVIMNADDPMHKSILKVCKQHAKVYTYGLNQAADIHVQSMKWTLNGMSLQVSSPWGHISLNATLLGDFNVSNILAVFAALMAKGFELNAVAEAIEQLQAAPGRMQVVAKQPLVLVDYAHTPDALEKVLQTLKKFKTQTHAGSLWVVFGCGGDRDPFKRPLMGKIAHQYADYVVVTSDNPRTEEPESIINQILNGLPHDADLANVMTITDRKLAIISCLEDAHDNDIVLIAGKGHENYQIIGSEKLFFSDQSVVQEYYFEMQAS